MSDESPIKTTEARAKLLSAILDAAPSILSAARKINRVSVGGMLRKTETSDNLALFVPPPTKRGVATGNDDPYGLFPVTVSQTGGSAGDATTACSFTYTATDLDANELGTGMSPTWARPAAGAMVAATHGLGYYDSTGAFVLYQVDEQPDVVSCGVA